MSKDKRPFPQDGKEETSSQEKRTRMTFPNVVKEALRVEHLNKLWPFLEPLFRKVVGEEVERALANLAPKLGNRAPPRLIQETPENQQCLRLQFRNKLALPLFTGTKVEGEDNLGIQVAIIDAISGDIVSIGPEASAKLDVVVLEGDFTADDEDTWAQSDFENAVLKERDGKRPLLTGELTVTLKEGLGTLGEFQFTDNSSWIRSRKFRLGVKVAPGFCEGVRIREAKTESFTVKDHRGELYKKHYPPGLEDEVWRLDKIGKDGAFHKRLAREGINNVEGFLRLYVMAPAKLRTVLGNGMSNKMWDGTVEHAQTTPLNAKMYVYRPAGGIDVIFNNVFQLMGLVVKNQYQSADSLSDAERVYVEKLVKTAHENYMRDVVEYDGEALIERASSLRASSTQVVNPIRAQGSGSGNLQAQVGGGQLQVIPSTHGASTSQLHEISYPAVSARNGNGAIVSRSYDQGLQVTQLYPSQSMQPPVDNQTVRSMNFEQQTVLASHSGRLNSGGLMTGLVLGPTPSSPLTSPAFALPLMPPGGGISCGYQEGTDWRQSYQRQESNAWQFPGLITDDSRNQELIGPEESMALNLYSDHYANYSNNTGGFWQDETNYNYSTSSPGLWNMGDERPRRAGHFGWLKLKAALRWGILRRTLPGRHAQLEEHESD